MKAVKFVMTLVLVVMFAGKPVWASESNENTDGGMATEEFNDQAFGDSEDNGAAFAESAVKPYEGFLQANDEIANQLNDLTSEASEEPKVDDEAKAEAPAVAAEEIKKEVSVADSPIIEAVKADIKERSKTSGKLDLYDGEINKVRTLDLIEYKPETSKDGDATVVHGDFRDTSTGDVVSLNINVVEDKGAYGIKDMTIASVKKPEVKEAKKDYSDDELKSFMKDYIDTQSQATGSFDLYDEKAKKMRNLQFVSLEDKLRRYGIIAIATAEFTDKATGDTVKVDVNTENKNGLSVTAMRLKSVSKQAATTPAEAK